jgi:hypothetical protein
LARALVGFTRVHRRKRRRSRRLKPGPMVGSFVDIPLVRLPPVV